MAAPNSANVLPVGDGLGQPPSCVRILRVSLADQLLGQAQLGSLRLPWPAQTFRFTVSAGVAAGDVFVAFGTPDEGAGSDFDVAKLTDVSDVVLNPYVRLRTRGVQHLILYSRTALVGQTLLIHAFRDAEIALSPGEVSVSELAITGPLAPNSGVAVGPPEVSIGTQGIVEADDTGLIVLPANADRRGGLIQNQDATLGVGLFFDGSGVYADAPIKLPAGRILPLSDFSWLMRFNIWAVAPTGETVDVGVVEFED